MWDPQAERSGGGPDVTDRESRTSWSRLPSRGRLFCVRGVPAGPAGGAGLPAGRSVRMRVMECGGARRNGHDDVRDHNFEDDEQQPRRAALPALWLPPRVTADLGLLLLGLLRGGRRRGGRRGRRTPCRLSRASCRLGRDATPSRVGITGAVRGSQVAQPSEAVLEAARPVPPEPQIPVTLHQLVQCRPERVPLRL